MNFKSNCLIYFLINMMHEFWQTSYFLHHWNEIKEENSYANLKIEFGATYKEQRINQKKCNLWNNKRHFCTKWKRRHSVILEKLFCDDKNAVQGGKISYHVIPKGNILFLYIILLTLHKIWKYFIKIKKK